MEVVKLNRKMIKKYMKKNADFRHWLKTNEEWFNNNPGTLKGMLETDGILSTIDEAIGRKRRKYLRRIAKIQKKTKKQ
jgi:hypothetical protein